MEAWRAEDGGAIAVVHSEGLEGAVYLVHFVGFDNVECEERAFWEVLMRNSCSSLVMGVEALKTVS